MRCGQASHTSTERLQSTKRIMPIVLQLLYTGSKFVCAGDEDELFDSCVYQLAVGSQLYLSTGTRLDIAFAVGMIAKSSSKVTKQHWMGVKIIFRYLRGTTELGLLHRKKFGSELSVGWGP